MALLRICVRAIGLVSTVILARLLLPEDFGVIAMATSVIAFLELATAFSFDIPLIQNQNAERAHYDTAWTLNVALYSILTLVLILLAPVAASFYQEPRLTPVIYVLAIAFFVKGFQNTGVVEFRKNLRFAEDFKLMLSQKLIGFLVTVPLAFYLRSYWALIAGMLVSNLGAVALTYLLHPFRPVPSLSAAKEMLSFSKWLLLNNCINFLRTRSPDFVVGRMAGTSSLGLFTVAYEISTLPTTELVAPINRAALPGYARLASDTAALRSSYLDVLSVIAFISLPAGFGISIISQPAVDLLLGEHWSASAPLVTILAIFGAVHALQTNTSSVFNALGKPYLITALGVANSTILLTSAIGLALSHGVSGVAIAYLGTSIVMLPLTLYLAARELRFGFKEVFRVLWRPVTCTMVMFTIVVQASASGWITSNALLLTLLVLTGVFAYSGATLLLWALGGRPRSAEFRVLGMFLAAPLARIRATVTGR